MSKMNIRPVFLTRFQSSLRGAGIFYLIMIIINAGIAGSYAWAYSRVGTSSGIVSFNGQGFAAGIMLFISGIICIREDLRMGIQHGVSRQTAFVSTVLSTVLIAFILSVAGEILMAVTKASMLNYPSFNIDNMYHIIFPDALTNTPPIIRHIESIIITFSALLLAYMTGIFVSLVYFRLNKVWTVIVSIGVPVFFTIILPILLGLYTPMWLSRLVQGLIEWALSGPWNLILSYTAAAVIAAVLNWLLLRRAPIMAAKK